MAEDGFGLLDALGLAVAHILGASLGGMIAQTMAVRHPGMGHDLPRPVWPALADAVSALADRAEHPRSPA